MLTYCPVVAADARVGGEQRGLVVLLVAAATGRLRDRLGAVVVGAV